MTMRHWQRTAMLGVTAIGVAGAVVFGADAGTPAQTPRLLSGSAWLPSPKVGQVTLLDGSSTEVAAQLQVAAPGTNLDVVQHGTTAYAIDRTAGTIRRIDGATYTMTPPEAPIADSGNGLTAFAASNALYAVDTKRGILSVLDPKTLARQGNPVPLSADLTTESTVVDNDSRLWFVDNATGELTSIKGTDRTTSRVASKGRNVLTMAGGRPVVIDTAARKAVVVDPDNASVDATFDLGLRQDDSVTVSAGNQRVYMVAARGALIICDIAKRDCGNVIPLNQGSSLGTPVEAGNRVFVPDHTAGQVWIIDLANRSVVAKAQVLTPRSQFQLINRDGVVFYNDTDSERAGVIQLDGSFTPIAKFDPANPAKGLTGASPGAEAPAQGGPPVPANPSTPPATPGPPDNPPNSPNPPNPSYPSNPPNGPVTIPEPPAPPPPSPSPQQQHNPDQPPPPEPVTLKITLSKTTPILGEDVTLQVATTSGAVPRSADWDFGDGAKKSAAMVTHRWATARTFQVSVQVTMPDNRTATTSVSVTVSEVPKAKLTVTAPENGKITGTGINCPPTCTVTVNKGQSITLAAQANPNFTFAGWGGACTGTGACQVAMTADKTVSARFNAERGAAFIGTWVNVDPATRSIVRAEITRTSPTTMSLNMFGSCSPDPCEWGRTTATLQGNTLRAFYDQGFATRTVVISQSGGGLVINIHHDYIPPDTREDRDSTDTMRKN
ncbi:hypothetical protein JOF56_006556 [Kibdelosporangium banguiense]|uniref:PKD domain-containing protein n=1 Tax=Kibdelosporangium banguiense TaxID=1365924 RepID=A0ABS4TQM2_9PSEU|nr:PKD domain-containing protein [Kibdelosporangium banguiense]MBP2326171.1 hypothetical protein [Kibdelosporangium banguiense]